MGDVRAGDALRIAYTMSAFPVVTETFILFEIIELERIGVHVDIYPLRPKGAANPHPEALPLARRTHYASLRSRKTLAAQVALRASL